MLFMERPLITITSSHQCSDHGEDLMLIQFLAVYALWVKWALLWKEVNKAHDYSPVRLFEHECMGF